MTVEEQLADAEKQLMFYKDLVTTMVKRLGGKVLVQREHLKDVIDKKESHRMSEPTKLSFLIEVEATIIAPPKGFKT